MKKAQTYTVRLYDSQLSKARKLGRKVGISQFIRDLIDAANEKVS